MYEDMNGVNSTFCTTKDIERRVTHPRQRFNQEILLGAAQRRSREQREEEGGRKRERNMCLQASAKEGLHRGHGGC